MSRLIKEVPLFDSFSYTSGSGANSAETESMFGVDVADYMILDLLLTGMTAATGRNIKFRCQAWSSDKDGFDAANADELDMMRVERNAGTTIADNFTVTIETAGPTFLDQQWSFLVYIGLDKNSGGYGLPRWLRAALQAPSGAMTSAIITARARFMAFT